MPETMPEPDANSIEALICCGGGLFHLADGSVRRVHKGIFYGLTRHRGFYYLFERPNRKRGQLWRFRWDGECPIDRRVIYDKLSGGVHQVDFIGDDLYVIDSYRNAILVLGLHGRRKHRYFPRGRLSDGRQSPNYVHFNSIFAADDRIYLLAHNECVKTGKQSDVLVFDRKMREIDVLHNRGRCSHNVLIHGDLFLSCDSMEGTLTNHGQPVLELGQYTRGLAMNDDVILVGGSVYSERGERLSKDSYVYIIDRNFNLLDTIEIIGGGQTHEIRLLGTDCGLSNTGTGE